MTAPSRSNRSLRVVTVVVLAAVFLCCGSTLTLTARNFLTFGARSKQSEAKSNLKAIAVSQQAWFDQHQRYTASFEELGFVPERGNRYRYVLALDGGVLVPGATPDGGAHSAIAADPRASPPLSEEMLLEAIPAALRAEVGVQGACPEACRMTVLAVGDIDVDPTVDVWSISTEARVIDGESIPAGTPFKHVDDSAE